MRGNVTASSPTAPILVERSPLAAYHIFAKDMQKSGHLTIWEMNLLRRLAVDGGWIPEHTFLVRTPYKEALRRLKQRDRKAEETIEEEFLCQLELRHRAFIQSGLCGEVHILDGSLSKHALLTSAIAEIDSLGYSNTLWQRVRTIWPWSPPFDTPRCDWENKMQIARIMLGPLPRLIAQTFRCQYLVTPSWRKRNSPKAVKPPWEIGLPNIKDTMAGKWNNLSFPPRLSKTTRGTTGTERGQYPPKACRSFENPSAWKNKPISQLPIDRTWYKTKTYTICNSWWSPQPRGNPQQSRLTNSSPKNMINPITNDDHPLPTHINPNIDIWVSYLGGPYRRLTIKKKGADNWLTNQIGEWLDIPPKLLSIWYGRWFLSDIRWPTSVTPAQGSFIRVELALLGGGTKKLETSDNSPIPQTPSCTRRQERASGENTNEPIWKNKRVHWADIDNRPMDFSISSLPPELLTLTEAQIKDDNEAFHRQMPHTRNSKRETPKGELMQGHLFWGPSVNTTGLRDFVLSRAEHLRHKVCVILEHQGQRLYSSFQDRFHFWKYYSSYKGTRCFYWINRSFERKQETALLHFNIEWYSSTTDRNALKK